MANIKFWYKIGGKLKVDSYACFASIKREPVEEVRYLAFVSSLLSKEHVDFYMNFISRMFPKEKFTYQYAEIKGEAVGVWDGDIGYGEEKVPTTPKGRWVAFRLNTKRMEFHKWLTYMTAVRYLHEFPSFVKDLMEKANKKNIFVQFRAFQQIHLDAKTSSNHGLICASAFYSDHSKKPISLFKFRKNLQDPKKTSVWSHFV